MLPAHMSPYDLGQRYAAVRHITAGRRGLVHSGRTHVRHLAHGLGQSAGWGGSMSPDMGPSCMACYFLTPGSAFFAAASFVSWSICALSASTCRCSAIACVCQFSASPVSCRMRCCAACCSGESLWRLRCSCDGREQESGEEGLLHHQFPPTITSPEHPAPPAAFAPPPPPPPP